jgi:hypothetical protein
MQRSSVHLNKNRIETCNLIVQYNLTFLAVQIINPLNAELNPIRHLLALVVDHHFVHVSRVMVKAYLLCHLLLPSSVPLRSAINSVNIYYEIIKRRQQSSVDVSSGVLVNNYYEIIKRRQQSSVDVSSGGLVRMYVLDGHAVSVFKLQNGSSVFLPKLGNFLLVYTESYTRRRLPSFCL